MRIWIVNYYAGIPATVGNPRYLKLAKHFMDAGHEVITFDASGTAHLSDSEFKAGDFWKDNMMVFVLYTLKYPVSRAMV